MLVALVLLVPSSALADAGCDPETCNGFACDAGKCGTTCNVDGDCAPGFKCDTAHDKCVVPNPESARADNGSCAYGGPAPAPLLLLLGMLGLLRRR